MKFSADKTYLTKILQLGAGIIQKKTTMPILSNFLLEVGDASLRIVASNLNITCVSSMPVQVFNKGSITVNARMLTDLVRELPEGQILFNLQPDDRIEIVAGKTKLKINGLSSTEFPIDYRSDLNLKLTLPASELNDLINKVIYAVSEDEAKYILGGILVEAQDHKLKMVGTDGHRLALVEKAIQTADFGSAGIVIPKRGFFEIKRLLDEVSDKTVKLGIIDKMFVVDADEHKMFVRLIDGEYPAYSKVIPTSTGTSLRVNKQSLEQALKRLNLLITDKSKKVILELGAKTLKLSGSSAALGEGQDEIDIDYSGQTILTAFNGKYILDVLNCVPDEKEIIIEIFGNSGPAIFKVVSDPNFQSFIMPIRLES